MSEKGAVAYSIVPIILTAVFTLAVIVVILTIVNPFGDSGAKNEDWNKLKEISEFVDSKCVSAKNGQSTSSITGRYDFNKIELLEARERTEGSDTVHYIYAEFAGGGEPFRHDLNGCKLALENEVGEPSSDTVGPDTASVLEIEILHVSGSSNPPEIKIKARASDA